MLKIEEINSFLGFADEGDKKGEYYFSSGFRAKRGGIEPGWLVVQEAKSSSVASLSLVNWFSERREGNPYIYAVNDDGIILKSQDLFGNWAAVHDPGTSSHGNGLITDHSSSQRVLYAQDQYLGSYDGTVWYDTFKNFGGPLPTTTDPRPMDLYENWVVCGNGSQVALLSITDDSWNASAFTLPASFKVNALKSGATGILIGANFSSRGVLILWDALRNRSIAPWLWTTGEIKGIAKYKGIWLVSTGREILLTDGYRIIKSWTFPDTKYSTYNFGPNYPAGMIVDEDKLLISGTGLNYNRLRKGIYILNLATDLWEFCPISTNNIYAGEVYSFFTSSLNTIYVSYTDTSLSPSQEYIGYMVEGAATGIYISPKVGAGNRKKRGKAVVIDLEFDTESFNVYSSAGLTLTAKLFDFQRQLWGVAITNGVGSAADKIPIDGTATTYNVGEVGDEVTIMNGANAGLIRHVKSIAGAGTASEVWTLDSNLTSAIASGIYINVSPFKLLGTKTITTDSIKENRIYFPIKNAIVGRKFLIKIVANITNMRPHIGPLWFVYDELKL